MVIRWTKIKQHERGLVFRAGVFERLLRPGRHLIVDPLLEVRVEKVSTRQAWLVHRELEVIAQSGALAGEALVLDLKDHQRALVWIDGRLDAVVGPGLHGLWTAFHEVRAEVADARAVRFEHPELAVVLAANPSFDSLLRQAASRVAEPITGLRHGPRGARELLEPAVVAAGWVSLAFVDGRHVATLAPGVHAFWKSEGLVKVVPVDLREQAADVTGQEIMTADRVTLRLNALVTFKVVDPLRAVTEVADHAQALHRQAQLVLRAVVGTRELDALLADKDGVARELLEMLRSRVEPIGLEVHAVGIRDVILPGEMKEILNRVTEAKKAAEAALITRREETAAIRSQANTARVFESNPTLMRLRELEVLEKVAEKANLSVVVGDGGLADRVVKLL
jgi:regulator of protease activity HflC (stomatin/prohibitin superfamily)